MVGYDLDDRGRSGDPAGDAAERGRAEVGEVEDVDLARADQPHEPGEREGAEATGTEEEKGEPLGVKPPAHFTFVPEDAHGSFDLCSVQCSRELDELATSAMKRALVVYMVARDEHA